MPISKLFLILAAVIIAAGLTVWGFALLQGNGLPVWPLIAGILGLSLVLRLLTATK